MIKSCAMLSTKTLKSFDAYTYSVAWNSKAPLTNPYSDGNFRVAGSVVCQSLTLCFANGRPHQME
jgi:hypothetical protein